MAIQLVGGFNLPLWKMMEFVSWDDDIPNIWKNKTCSKPPTSRSLWSDLRNLPWLKSSPWYPMILRLTKFSRVLSCILAIFLLWHQSGISTKGSAGTCPVISMYIQCWAPQWCLLVYKPVNTTVIGIINHNVWSYVHQLSYPWGPTLYIYIYYQYYIIIY